MPESLPVVSAPTTVNSTLSGIGSSINSAAGSISNAVTSTVSSVSVGSTTNTPIPAGSTVITAPAAAAVAYSLMSGKVTAGSIATAAASAVGLNTNMPPSQAINILAPGLTKEISSTISGAIAEGLKNVDLSKLNFPNIQIPGLGQAAILIGAGPKWVADQILKYKMIVPPFAPGLKINMAMVSAALSIVKAAASGNLGAIAKSLLEDILEDIKDQSGLNDLQEQIQDQISDLKDSTGLTAIEKDINTITNVVDNAQGMFVQEFNRANPPQTTTDADGNTVEIPAPSPNVSQYTNLKEIFSTEKVEEKISQRTEQMIQVPSPQMPTSTNSDSNPRAFTYPPNS